MQIQIVNKSDNPNPTYQTKFSAGMDLMSYLEEPIIIKPGEFKLISTGIYIKLPESIEEWPSIKKGGYSFKFARNNRF